MKLVAIVQARMSSRRYPSKALAPVDGKPLIAFLLERIERAKSKCSVVVATSDEATDDPIAALCRDRSVTCWRGPLNRVAERFLQVLRAFQPDAFVRISGDSPLLDPALIDRAIALFRKLSPDLVTNVFPRSFPVGQTVEVVDSQAFRSAYSRIRDDNDQEHVTTVFYNFPNAFSIHNFRADFDAKGVHLAVDRPEDLQTVNTIVEIMDRPHWEYGVEELVNLYRHAKARTGLCEC